MSVLIGLFRILVLSSALVTYSFAADTPSLLGFIYNDTTNVLFGTNLIAVGDVTEDGTCDLLLDNGRFTSYLYRGGSSFDTVPYLKFRNAGPYGGGQVDLNGDGVWDFVLKGGSSTGRKMNGYLGGPELDTLRDIWFGQDSAPPCLLPVFARDLNANGSPELIISSCDYDGVTLFELGNGSDSLADVVFRSSGLPPGVYGSIGYENAVGDFNGDGADDLALSQLCRETSQLNGRVHFYFGGLGFDTTPDFTLVRRNGWASHRNYFGSLLSCPGDLNGDGFDDLLVSSAGLDDSTWIYFGGTTLDTNPAVTFPGPLYAAAPAGDINRDGYDDLIASYFGQYSGEGSVFVWYGGEPFDDQYDIRINNWDNTDFETYFGQDVVGLGDFNGDGVDDFAFSCYDVFSRGKIYVYSGTGIPVDVPYEHQETLPSGFLLNQNYPNPFNPTTTISFDLPGRANVSLTIHNILGQEISHLINRELPGGRHEVEWDGRDSSGRASATGIYLYRLTTPEGSLSMKMLLLK